MSSVVASMVGCSKTYGVGTDTAVTALHECDLEIRKGDYLSIIGPSGSGKSTFLNLLGLVDAPTTGTVIVGAQNATALSEKRRSALRGANIGFVFQSFHLLPRRSATENVAMATLYRGYDLASSMDLANEALRRVGLMHRRSALPETLSGGERQRVAIARAIAGRPALLLCDEPTGNLDSKNTRQIAELLEGLNQDGTTIVLITHDLNVAAGAREVRELDDGYLSAAQFSGRN